MDDGRELKGGRNLHYHPYYLYRPNRNPNPNTTPNPYPYPNLNPNTFINGWCMNAPNYYYVPNTSSSSLLFNNSNNNENCVLLRHQDYYSRHRHHHPYHDPYTPPPSINSHRPPTTAATIPAPTWNKNNIIPKSQKFAPSSLERRGGAQRVTNTSRRYPTNAMRNPLPATSKVTVSLPVDVVAEILRRLPARCVVRFRGVCKLWNSLTQESQFIAQHLENKLDACDLGIATLHSASTARILYIHYHVNGWHKFDMSRFIIDKSYRLSNSLNGLVCVYGAQTSYLVNPSIREVLPLPDAKVKCTTSMALCQDISTREYLVVRLFYCGFRRRRGCEILKLGPDSDSWRRIEYDDPYFLVGTDDPVVVNGAIHWLTRGLSGSPVAVSFDIKSETFNAIAAPKDFMYDPMFITMKLVDMCGHLCVVCTSSSFIHLWVCKGSGGDGNVEWQFIECQLRTAHMIYGSRPVMVRDGKIVWQPFYGSNEFDCYDLRSNTLLEPLCEPGKYPYKDACSYKESLISPKATLKRSSARDLASGNFLSK